MSPGKKILIGIFTFSQIGALVMIFAFFFSQLQDLEAAAQRHHGEPADEFFRFMAGFFGGIVIIFLLSVGNIIFYCIHASRNPAVRQDMRVVWILIFIFGGFMGELVYYFIHIVNEPPALPSNQKEPFT
jgi:sterol desaturase/sphingolipid hydroxylase (fatty acid hydroxylase superfamily)